ncbi:hypothetical protein O6H91_09G077500 [Diphasiastrum complanatum]|uniref:Uncharacterized protein n=1 Tax=Diphasiastrum complanatum TaxID=34168 RepID=A0ACC2CQZ5_DIPCM|nr:hypothetical protein O6H91_09G077500 [Diphasiastrum complanatum]
MERYTSFRVCDYLQSSNSCTGCMIGASGFPSVSGSSLKRFAGPFQRDHYTHKGFDANLDPESFHKFEDFGKFGHRSISERKFPCKQQNIQPSVSSSASAPLTTLIESSAAGRGSLCVWSRLRRARGYICRPKESSTKLVINCALGARGPECADDTLGSKEKAEGVDIQAIEGRDWSSNQLLSSSNDHSDQFWEQLSIIFRVSYAVALYGGLAFASNVICNFTGIDSWGGFQLCANVAIKGLGYAVPPMMILLFILDDEVVRNWPPARAIRDVEDEELMNFFVGMGPWQFLFVVLAGASSEELFFRVAVQGGLAHAIQMSGKGMNETPQGLSALTGIVPLFLPFAQIFAAVLSAALTGSMYYVISSPRDPTYVIAPVTRGRNTRRDIKRRFEVWYERRQLKKIYSPLMESLLALYLGFEWVQTGNILAPMITHTLYSIVVVGNGLRRINSQKEKLRQRVSEIVVQRQGQNRDSKPEQC